MKMKYRVLLSALALSTAFSTSAMAAEPTLTSILGTIEAGTWTQTSFSALSSSSWNKAGTVLDFKFVSENTSWSPFQTFSIVDGSSTNLVFAGVDTNGATSAYTLNTLFSNYKFGETNPSANFSNDYSKVFVSNSGIYAFAHEDWTDHDYNDFVVTLKVSPVPEPETYAMMLVGLAGIGFVARKKKQA